MGGDALLSDHRHAKFRLAGGYLYELLPTWEIDDWPWWEGGFEVLASEGLLALNHLTALDRTTGTLEGHSARKAGHHRPHWLYPRIPLPSGVPELV